MSRKSIVLRWERASLVFEDGDYKRALDLYSKILKVLSKIRTFVIDRECDCECIVHVIATCLQ